MMKSSLMRINLIFILLVLFIPNLTSAETKTFVREYTYQASEEDSRNSSRVIALREVKRLLLEELGTYLESITEVQNFKLTKDQITTLTAGIVQTEIVEEKWDGHTYWLKSKIAADSGEVIKAIDVLRKDREKTKELKEVRKRSEELLRENERLRKKLTVAKGEKRKEQKVEYDRTIKNLTAIEWFEKGYASDTSGNYNDAVNAYSKAIVLDPKYVEAYYKRGFAYSKLGQYQRAIKDYDEAIRLKSDDAELYVFRGGAYYFLGQHQRAIEDYTQAIRLKSDFAEAYTLRGAAYNELGQYQQAVVDHNQAIRLKPDFAGAYAARGVAYAYLGQYKNARENYDEAIRLKPNNKGTYYNYACLFALQKDAKQACKWLRWAIEKGFKNWKQFETDKDFDSIRNEKCFVDIIKKNIHPVRKNESTEDADQRYRGIKGIELRNGNIIEGKIVSWNPDIVKIQTKDGKVLSYDFKKEVQTFITE